MDDISVAYRMAKKGHWDQVRDQWEDYFKEHILWVLKIYLDELRGNSLEWALTCLLHDSVEDTEEIDFYIIEKFFWKQVAENVKFLTKPSYASYLPPANKKYMIY